MKDFQKLELCETKVTDLSELEHHPEITYLRLSKIPATDYSVLLLLPNLKTVVASSDEGVYIEPVAELGTFEVVYE